MNADRLLAQYWRIADAPDATALMREFILDLAVRGKLVPQDPIDEPASELLKRIEAEKTRLVLAREIRDKPSLPAVGDKDRPFEIPEAWSWVRFANIVDFSAGRTPSRNDPSFWNSGDHAWVSIADMADGQVLTTTKETVSNKARDRIFGSEPETPGTLIMSFKLTIGKIARLGIPAFHNEAIISIKPHLPDLDAYLFKVLPQFAKRGNAKGAIKGATLNRESISNLLLPLPPLSEQHRITAKVDELMALCDRLEAARIEREATRDRLAGATLARLDAPDADNFNNDAHFALDALPGLTTRPDQIKQLRQTILSLAVRGKLVPQDPKDEPASQLLKRIAAEKAHLVTAGKLKKFEPPADLTDSDHSQQTPDGWVVTNLQSVCVSVTDGDHLPPPKTETGIPFLVIGNVRSQKIDFSGSRFVASHYYEALDPIRRPTSGDLLYTLVGSYGIPVVVRDDRPFCVQRHIGILRPSALVDVNFLERAMGSRLVFDQASACATGIAQKTVPLSGLRKIVVALPPVAEQRRIVAKVDELMALCDRLEATLVAVEAGRAQLLHALLAEALTRQDSHTAIVTSGGYSL